LGASMHVRLRGRVGGRGIPTRDDKQIPPQAKALVVMTMIEG
jgi:hypothetical protein